MFLELLGELQASRKLAVSVLADVLSGDLLAAEFTLLHLLSSMYVAHGTVSFSCMLMGVCPCRHGRTELLALGKFALNISNCSFQTVSNLKHLFELLLTKVSISSHPNVMCVSHYTTCRVCTFHSVWRR